jgi:hypothetical protein
VTLKHIQTIAANFTSGPIQPEKLPALNSFATQTLASTGHRRTLYTTMAQEQSNFII